VGRICFPKRKNLKISKEHTEALKKYQNFKNPQKIEIFPHNLKNSIKLPKKFKKSRKILKIFKIPQTPLNPTKTRLKTPKNSDNQIGPKEHKQQFLLRFQAMPFFSLLCAQNEQKMRGDKFFFKLLILQDFLRIQKLL
jgi:hypothetical protein